MKHVLALVFAATVAATIPVHAQVQECVDVSLINPEAHDEKNKFKEGEKVSIIECKPYSKKKTWQVIT